MDGPRASQWQQQSRLREGGRVLFCHRDVGAPHRGRTLRRYALWRHHRCSDHHLPRVITLISLLLVANFVPPTLPLTSGGIVSNTLRPKIPESCDPEWKSLMEQCWSPEPSERPAFAEISNQLRAMAASIPQKGQLQAQAPAQPRK